jgi:hypothetical protein
MTHKDYVRLARALVYSRPKDGEIWDAVNLWKGVRQQVATELAEDNPRFDRGKFYAATEATP